ncbi:hypothetical protein CKA32_005714 [Geitlerinema sp. FC II]|nr:hypothetical protein CKA32_005714 [Geitlerinema sp. FC II]
MREQSPVTSHQSPVKRGGDTITCWLSPLFTLPSSLKKTPHLREMGEAGT